ncbi:IPT/TIG domain-containing protein [Ferruginibacter sp. SUN106]|uniref:IPT/TIG domain-containing protein n=1 Tax=Ferruginibacter sp. SUN106 TaxID=2978348 RepID=UPI003D35F7D8
MKKIFFNIPMLSVFCFAIIFSACKKDGDGSPDYKSGTPATTIGIKPDSGSGGVMLTLTGTGLGQMRSIVFDNKNVPAPFQSTLNTEENIIFRVPDTAYGGPQNIIFTNVDGKTLKVPFRVLAYPVVSTIFPTDFISGTTVTITGSNLDDVTAVVLNGTTDAATIVSKTRGTLVITMPATSLNRGFLKLTNATGSVVATQEMVNVAKASIVFDEALQNGFQDWGWGGTYTASTDDKITGLKSFKGAYDPAGSWGGIQLGGGNITLTTEKYFTFWAKGADVDKNVDVNLNWNNAKKITIPANKWTYFKYTLATDFPGTTSVNTVVFQINDAGKTIYFDNIMFVK